MDSQKQQVVNGKGAATDGVDEVVVGCGGLSLAPDVETGEFVFPASQEGGSSGSGGLVGDEDSPAVFELYASVRMRRDFNPRALEKAMRSAWAPLGSLSMDVVEENLFLFKFDCRLDVNRVLREGPWRFNDHPIAIKEVVVGRRVGREELTLVPYWVQIYNIPPFQQTEDFVRYVGALFSKEVLEVDVVARRQSGVSPSFVRARVMIDTMLRLPRGTSVWVGETKVEMAFKFERLLRFCYTCGMVDHEMDDCEGPFPEELDPAKPPFGDWLRGIPPRIPAWQQFGSGLGGGGNAGNPFVKQQSSSRRPSISMATPVPRIAWANKELTPKYPPGFEPAAFSVGVSENRPPKCTSIRPIRQKVLEEDDQGKSGGKKRAADLMETSPSCKGKGANPFLSPAV